MNAVIPCVLLIAVGIFAMVQNAYYTKKIALIEDMIERDIDNAKSEGYNEALNDPQAVVQAYHKTFTYTMN
jgi:hypothetical protein